jgi:hypothetical protein
MLLIILINYTATINYLLETKFYFLKSLKWCFIYAIDGKRHNGFQRYLGA